MNGQGGAEKLKIPSLKLKKSRKEQNTMARPTKSVNQMSMKMSKLERETRATIEAELTAAPKTKPKPVMILNKAEKKLFNKFVKLNDNFTEADSISLSMLTKSLYSYTELMMAAEELDIFDDARGSLERRALAYDKAVQQHMAALSISLTQRLRMANDMAKVMIEEKKLANMEAQNNQAVNPLMALLEDDDYE
ncbi:hypothetical protein [Bacillus cereus]|uniref:hypothetical protein n=1 Tax=Bacillus cereus TaxID=1396 RepID=UPI00397AC764